MTAHLSFLPVGNGDMTFVQTEGGRTILIDMNIRATVDGPHDDTPDVASKLREKLLAKRICHARWSLRSPRP